MQGGKPTGLDKLKAVYAHGVDVSEWQGVIDWKRVKADADFAIIRAGYGQNNIDKQAVRNVKGAIENELPYGLYWFSYAVTPADADRESQYLEAFIEANCGASLPRMVAFDYEYASVEYAENKGGDVSVSAVRQVVDAFMTRMNKYNPYLYINPDFMKRYFNGLAYKYWLAQWPVEPKNFPFGFEIWQYGSNGSVMGINTRVDVNLSEWGVWNKVDKPWYVDTVEWAQKAGIMDGTRADETATRAETAQMIRNALKYFTEVMDSGLENKDKK